MDKIRVKKFSDVDGAAKTEKEILLGIARDKEIEAIVGTRNPFKCGDQGWYAWIAWAKMQELGFRMGEEPIPENFTRYLFRMGNGPTKGIIRICKRPILPSSKVRY